MSDTQKPARKSDEELQEAIAQMLKENPGGFSVSPGGVFTPDRQAIEIKSIQQFSDLAREPKTVAIDLQGGKIVKFRIRPLDAEEYKEIDKLDSEAPMPPKKEAPRGPSLAKNVRASGLDEYNWDDVDYKRKLAAHRELKRAAVIVKGLLEVEVPGDNLDQKRDHLQKSFPPRILDAIEGSIRAVTSDPIERAFFS